MLRIFYSNEIFLAIKLYHVKSVGNVLTVGFWCTHSTTNGNLWANDTAFWWCQQLNFWGCVHPLLQIMQHNAIMQQWNFYYTFIQDAQTF